MSPETPKDNLRLMTEEEKAEAAARQQANGDVDELQTLMDAHENNERGLVFQGKTAESVTSPLPAKVEYNQNLMLAAAEAARRTTGGVQQSPGIAPGAEIIVPDFNKPEMPPQS